MKNTTKSTQSKQGKPSRKQGKKPTKVTGPKAEVQEVMSGEQTAEVAAVNRLHNEIFQTSKMTTEKAMDLGGRLVKLKHSLGHGKWLPFVKAHLSFSDKTAERYMNVYKNRKALAAKFDKVSNFALTDAYGFIAEAKKPDSGHQQPSTQAEVPQEADKNAVMRELSRSVREQLKPLSAERTSQFKEALLSFMKGWIEQQVGGSENVMKLTVLPSPVIAREEREVQGLRPEAGLSDIRPEIPAEGVGVAA